MTRAPGDFSKTPLPSLLAEETLIPNFFLPKGDTTNTRESSNLPPKKEDNSKEVIPTFPITKTEPNVVNKVPPSESSFLVNQPVSGNQLNSTETRMDQIKDPSTVVKLNETTLPQEDQPTLPPGQKEDPHQPTEEQKKPKRTRKTTERKRQITSKQVSQPKLENDGKDQKEEQPQTNEEEKKPVKRRAVRTKRAKNETGNVKRNSTRTKKDKEIENQQKEEEKAEPDKVEQETKEEDHDKGGDGDNQNQPIDDKNTTKVEIETKDATSNDLGKDEKVDEVLTPVNKDELKRPEMEGETSDLPVKKKKRLTPTLVVQTTTEKEENANKTEDAVLAENPEKTAEESVVVEQIDNAQELDVRLFEAKFEIGEEKTYNVYDAFNKWLKEQFAEEYGENWMEDNRKLQEEVDVKISEDDDENEDEDESQDANKEDIIGEEEDLETMRHRAEERKERKENPYTSVIGKLQQKIFGESKGQKYYGYDGNDDLIDDTEAAQLPKIKKNPTMKKMNKKVKKTEPSKETPKEPKKTKKIKK